MRIFQPLETLKRWIRHYLLDVHTAMPCKVLKYDAAAQTVDLEPQVEHYLFDDDDNATAEALPTLFGVKVQFPRAGGIAMTWPITKGDFMMCHFAEEPTNAWRVKGRAGPPGQFDRHGLNGAFAVPGGFPDTQDLSPAPSTDVVVISNDPTNAEFVALSAKTDAEIARIWTHLGTTFAATVNDGGLALWALQITAAGVAEGLSESVAATKVKVE